MLRKLTMGVGANYPLSLLRINSQEDASFLDGRMYDLYLTSQLHSFIRLR
jgi:hypothetical protein